MNEFEPKCTILDSMDLIAAIEKPDVSLLAQINFKTSTLSLAQLSRSWR
jgi:hypothetical protein